MRLSVLRIFRFRPVVGVLVVAGAVLALSAAAVEPFLASAGNAATSSELERQGPREAGLRVAIGGRLDPSGVEAAEALLAERVGAAAASPDATISSDPLTLEAEHGEHRARIASHSDAHALLGADSDGLLVPDVLAAELDLSVGTEVTLRRGDRTVALPVGGVYEALDADAPPPGMESLAQLTQAAPGREGRPPDLLFLAAPEAIALAGELATAVSLEWRFPVGNIQSLPAARSVNRRLADVTTAALDRRTTLGAALGDLSRARVEAEAGVGMVVREAERAVAALSGPVRAVGFAGQAVALAVVAAAGVFAARQRQIEYRLATIRGRGPLAQGARAAGESALPLAAGGLLGWAGALYLVTSLGPPGQLPAGTAQRALIGVGIVMVPALGVIAAATAASVAGTVRSGRRRRLRGLSKAPWELAVLALAAVALVQLRVGGGLAVVDGSPSLSPLVLAFPVLLLAGAAGLAGRGLRRALPSLRRRARGQRPSGFLTVRRLASAPTAAIALTAAAALALGLVVYAAALSDSLGTAVSEKASVQVGADAVALLSVPAEGATQVQRALGRLQPGGTAVDVLLVESASFRDIAFWDRDLAGTELGPLLDRLSTGDERLPIAVAGIGDEDPVSIDVSGARLPVEIASHAAALPGQSTLRPIVIADVSAADAVAGQGGMEIRRSSLRGEVWVAGEDARERLVAAGVPPELIRQATDAAAQPRLVAVTWALGALQAFGVMASTLGLAGVALFIAARQRATQVSYALARRMGLGRGAHRLALTSELLVLLGIATALATAFGVVAAGMVIGQIDPLPDLPPAPRLGLPLPALSALIAALGAAGAIGAALLQRSADRSNIAEVLRSA